jgi:hypothetical protein
LSDHRHTQRFGLVAATPYATLKEQLRIGDAVAGGLAMAGKMQQIKSLRVASHGQHLAMVREDRGRTQVPLKERAFGGCGVDPVSRTP